MDSPCSRLLLGLVLAACGSSDGKSNVSAGNPSGADAGDASGSDVDGSVSSPLPAGCEPIDPTYEAYARSFFEQRCNECHSVELRGAARLGAPTGVDFDSEADIAFHQTRIERRAIDERGMPPGAPLSDCDAGRLRSYLDALGGRGACTPECGGKDCGPDGCGGVCGVCELGEMCGSEGACVTEDCVPECAGVACGDDGCGGVCGTCGPGLGCSDGQCVCAPSCDGKSCGDDGCGGVCGECADGDVCSLDNGCLCIPSCEASNECGSDGCGGTCGSCPSSQTCTSESCECVPSCDGKSCGDDGCGGSCGSCTAPGRPECNTRTGKCVAMCMPISCASRECGDDGCGGSCGAGACGDGEVCNDGSCECEPNCAGKTCGGDGCGGSCGQCPEGLSCGAGQCGCTGSCEGRECGSDGCGGSCGECSEGMSCSDGECVAQCVPSCEGKECGSDGCGGSCGSCGAGQTCDADACADAEVSFETVFAIFERGGCADTGCHTASRKAEMLDLSNADVARAQLVSIDAIQCSGKKRVEPGDPAQSYLVNKLTGVGMCSGAQMPKGNPALSAADLDTIRTWIRGL